MEALRSLWFWLLAWIGGFAFYMVHADSPKLPDVLTGVLVGCIAATGTELVRRQRVAAIALRGTFLTGVWRVVVGVVPDVGRLTVAAFRQLVSPQPVRGRTVAIPFGHGGDDPPDNGRRALAQGLGSFAPNTIVIGVDPDRHRLIAHQLQPTGQTSDLDPLDLG